MNTFMPPRRWLQFSLRSMLILTAVAAIWLGWLVKQVRDQRAAVQAVRQLGGSVYYHHE